VEPGGEVECVVQAVHEALPSVGLKVLAGHALQAAESGEWPGTQRQSMTLLAASRTITVPSELHTTVSVNVMP
jgi:hypothetical protein